MYQFPQLRHVATAYYFVSMSASKSKLTSTLHGKDTVLSLASQVFAMAFFAPILKDFENHPLFQKKPNLKAVCPKKFDTNTNSPFVNSKKGKFQLIDGTLDFLPNF